MPTTSGVFSLVPSYRATTGQTIRAEQHNPPLEDIAQALTGRLPRDGSAAMAGALQMNGFAVRNLAAATADSDAVRLDQVTLYSAFLSSVAAISFDPNTFIYATGAGTAAKSNISTVGRQFLARTTAFGQREQLELGSAAERDVSLSADMTIGQDAVPTKLVVKTYVEAELADIISPLALVNFQGSNGDIRSQFNVSSVSYNGVGDYTVNFATAIGNATYVPQITISNTGTNSAVAYIDTTVGLSSGSFRIKVFNAHSGAAVSPLYVCVTVHSV